MTRTYAILELSPAAFNEVKAKLLKAGYEDQLHEDVIDMHDIAVTAGIEGSRFHDARELRLSLTRLIGPQDAEVAADIEDVIQRFLEGKR